MMVTRSGGRNRKTPCDSGEVKNEENHVIMAKSGGVG